MIDYMNEVLYKTRLPLAECPMPTTDTTPVQPRSYAAMAQLVLAHAERQLHALRSEATGVGAAVDTMDVRTQAACARIRLRNAKARQARALRRMAMLRHRLQVRLSQGAPAGTLLQQLQRATARLSAAAGQAATLRTAHAALRAALRASQVRDVL